MLILIVNVTVDVHVNVNFNVNVNVKVSANGNVNFNVHVHLNIEVTSAYYVTQKGLFFSSLHIVNPESRPIIYDLRQYKTISCHNNT